MTEKINICLIDFNEDDQESLKSDQYHLFNGTAGKSVEIDYSDGGDTRYCLINSHLPSNLHEFDVLVINMISKAKIPFKFEDHQRTTLTEDGETKLRVTAPTNVFDPRPIGFMLLENKIKGFLKKEVIIIVFADQEYKIKYQPVFIKNNSYPKDLEPEAYDNYSFLKRIESGYNKYGQKYNVVVQGELKQIIEDSGDLEYLRVFYDDILHEYDEEGNRIEKRNPNFLPLIMNADEEIISYAKFYEDLSLFVLPNVKNKANFTKEFLERIAPQISPTLFTSNSKINWLNNEEYWVPGNEEIITKINQEKKEHNQRIKNLEEEQVTNKEKYSFLTDLLIETDQKLVNACAEFLKWLGFNKVTIVDDEKEEGELEEDILIEYEDKFLVIEVKGIGGTSKDAECSQVSKIRYRRMMEKDTTKVSALYIVNHERYKPPLTRRNPPFTENQIQDAINDNRSLLTTWDMFNLYYNVEKEIISKEESRANLFKIGLIDFNNSLVNIGKVDKIFKEGKIGSIELIGNSIQIGDEVIIEKNGRFTKDKIISIQREKDNINDAQEGRVGVKLKNPIKRNSRMFKKGSS